MSAHFGIPNIKWGVTEEEFIEVLSDGKPHAVHEFTEPMHNTVYGAQRTIHRIRRKLNGSGYEVVTVIHQRRTYWRLMRTISTGE